MWVSLTHPGQGEGAPWNKTSADISAMFCRDGPACSSRDEDYRDPGDVADPVSPEAVPIDAIHPSEKMSREDLVKSAIREAGLPAPAPAAPVPVALVPVVPVSPFPVPVVVPLMSLLLEEPPHKRTVVITEKQATVSKPPPIPREVPAPGGPASRGATAPLEILSLETPFLDCFCGNTCAPRYTAPAAELTTTDSCTETRAIPCTSTAELATLASLIHSVPDGDASSSLPAPKVAEEPSVSSAATTTIADHTAPQYSQLRLRNSSTPGTNHSRRHFDRHWFIGSTSITCGRANKFLWC